MKKRILLLTPENREIHAYRKKQFNNFVQITMPYLAGFVDEAKYEVVLIDEYNQTIPYEQKFDLVAITVNTPNASHCYSISRRFMRHGVKVVMGGPHVTLLADEAKQHSDYLIVGEAEETWPQSLEAFYHGNANPFYACEQPPSLQGVPIARRDLIEGRKFTKGAVFATRGCPYNCRYCNLKQIYCPSFRMRPIREVIEERGTRSVHHQIASRPGDRPVPLPSPDDLAPRMYGHSRLSSIFNSHNPSQPPKNTCNCRR